MGIIDFIVIVIFSFVLTVMGYACYMFRYRRHDNMCITDCAESTPVPSCSKPAQTTEQTTTPTPTVNPTSGHDVIFDCMETTPTPTVDPTNGHDVIFDCDNDVAATPTPTYNYSNDYIYDCGGRAYYRDGRPVYDCGDNDVPTTTPTPTDYIWG